jgi:hypothetical protein
MYSSNVRGRIRAASGVSDCIRSPRAWSKRSGMRVIILACGKPCFLSFRVCEVQVFSARGSDLPNPLEITKQPAHSSVNIASSGNVARIVAFNCSAAI